MLEPVSATLLRLLVSNWHDADDFGDAAIPSAIRGSTDAQPGTAYLAGDRFPLPTRRLVWWCRPILGW